MSQHRSIGAALSSPCRPDTATRVLELRRETRPLSRERDQAYKAAMARSTFVLVCLAIAGCPGSADSPRDAGPGDVGIDSAVTDAGHDGGPNASPDVGPLDTGWLDSGSDAVVDAAVSTDSGADAGAMPDLVVTSCDEVLVPGAGASLPAVEGWLVHVSPRGTDAVFRAPAVARPTLLRVGPTHVLVEPRSTPTFDIPGLAADCGPFEHGVASGDPRRDGVTLWTRWSPPDASSTAMLAWVIATDSALSNVVANGMVEATPRTDWTVHVEVSGLEASHTYFFRFTAPDGTPSALGRARTSGSGGGHVRFAVASCSSLFSGYFNAYRRIAEREELDAVIHLGDYIYDFVDENERFRVPPSGDVEDPQTLEAHRRRHALYLSDPDLRAARQAHPWLVLWDNHDFERSAPEYGGGIQAFREWNPIRTQTAGEPPEVLYRALRYGDLVDVLIVDMYLFQRRDLLPGTDRPSALGTAQFDWLASELRASTAAWRVLAMQKVFAEFGPFSGWTSLPEARTQLIDLFRAESIDDNVFLTGDSHFTIFQDVVDQPLGPARYDPATGEGAIGAELLATSISRGNFDEQLGPSAPVLVPGLRSGFLAMNPHQVDLELTSHGYGIVDVSAERVINEVWYSPILEPSDSERFGVGYAVPRGANRYDRARCDTPTPGD